MYSFNHNTEKKELKLVTTIQKYLVSALVVLGLSNGDTLTTTPSHPFYHQGAYVEAQHLAVGDTLTAFNSTRPVWITYHESKQLRDTVYNFTVADNHNYYVGSDGVLVHNDCFLQTLEDNYPVVARKLDELDAPAKKAFQKQFANQGDEVLAKFNQGDGELVKAWGKFGDSPLRTNIKYLEAVDDFPPAWKIETNGGVTKILKENGDELAEFTEDLVKAKGGSKGSWNELLNKPPIKNHKYQVDKYLFETDELGRVKKVKGELEYVERGRNEYQQGLSVGLKDGAQGVDDGGHLIANILNGPGEQINYLPQKANLNRGPWKSMEDRWSKALQDGQKVEVEIVPIFKGNSKRPSSFVVRENVGGKQNVLNFPNE